jgi:hypothetical protein
MIEGEAAAFGRKVGKDLLRPFSGIKCGLCSILRGQNGRKSEKGGESKTSQNENWWRAFDA